MENKTVLVTQNAEGVPANQETPEARLSGNGQYVVFETASSNLLETGGDTNDVADIFVADMQPGPLPSITRVSLSSAGGQISGRSIEPDISSDGRLVSFKSAVSGIVPGVTPTSTQHFQIYVRDRELGTTMHVSRSDGGVMAEARCDGATLSSNGRYVVFSSKSDAIAPGNSGDLSDVFARDLLANKISRVSVSATGAMGNGSSGGGRASDNGLVVFSSSASNLVAGDSEGEADLFVAPADAPVAPNPSGASDAKVLQKLALQKQIAKETKKWKKAKKAGQTKKAKKFQKKIQKLKKALRQL